MNKRFFIVVLVLVAFPIPAFAYIDPVSGSMAIQAAIAIFAGASVFFRRQFRLLKLRATKLWQRLTGRTPPPQPEDQHHEGDPKS